MGSPFDVLVHGGTYVVDSILYEQFFINDLYVTHKNSLMSDICQCWWAFAPWGQGGENQEEPIRAGACLVPDVWRHLMKRATQKESGEGSSCYQQIGLTTSTRCCRSCCNDSLICHREMVTLLRDNGEMSCGYGCFVVCIVIAWIIIEYMYL